MPWPGQIEERVGGEVDHRRLVDGRCLILHDKFVLVGDRIDHAQRHRARIALLAVLEHVGHLNRGVVDLLGVEHHEARALLAAVQRVRPVVGGQLVFLAVEREFRLADAVGVAADERAHGGLAGLQLVDRLVAERHVAEHALLVGHQDLLDLGAPVGDLHHHAALVFDRVEVDLLAVDLLSILLALEFHLGCGLGWMRLERNRVEHSKLVWGTLIGLWMPPCGCGHRPELSDVLRLWGAIVRDNPVRHPHIHVLFARIAPSMKGFSCDFRA